MLHLRFFASALASIAMTVAFAQITVPSDGSDGAFSVSGNYTFDLSAAPTATWSTPAPVPGKGVYDPEQWAVVYKFSSFTYNGGHMYFTPHPSGCPVVILVQGNFAHNAGVVHLEGSPQAGIGQSVPGPGGFRGGASGGTLPGSAGFGPGGGNYIIGADGAGAGSYGTLGIGSSGPLYGGAKIIPLIGGSGGAGRYSFNYGGGGGGGAILIAAQNTITINDRIYAYGGSSTNTSTWGLGGSGGAVKLIANVVNITANATISAEGQSGGGVGRVRIEGNTRTVSGAVAPPPSATSAGTTPQIWPDSTTPKLEIVSIGAINTPADPRANLVQPDIELTSGGNKTIVVRAYNVPIDSTWAVQVRMTPRNGKESSATCTYVSGNQGISLWQCTLNFDAGAAALIARAYKL